jgi:hypothetical protein
MATTTAKHHQRSRLMRLLRLSPAVMLLAFVAGVLLVVVSLGLPDGAEADGWKHIAWDVGSTVLVLDGVLLVVVLWGGVYLQVVEASRGMPGLRSVEEPTMTPQGAATWKAWQRSLSDLGFRPDEWFALDDFDETHISAWRHDDYPAALFVLYYPVSGAFRVRIVRRFPSGGILVSSTRVNDLAIAPPQGLYVQVRTAATVEQLWGWHREAEALFPDQADRGATRPGGPRGLYIEVSARWAGHRRRDRTWLLAVEPVEECWRMYRLCGMPLRRQFALGWTTPYWR